METIIKEFNLNYKKYYPLVYTIIYKKIGLKEDSEDLCQEIFLVYYKSLNKVKIINIKKWLYGTMFHFLNHYYKKHKMEFKNISELEDDKNISFSDKHEIDILIKDVIINDKIFNNYFEQEAFKLIGFSGVSFRDAAIIFGLTIRQIRYQYHLILRRIKYNFQCIGIYNLEDLIC